MRLRRPQLSLGARQRLLALLVVWAAYLAGRHDGYQRALAVIYTSHLEGFVRGAGARR